MKARLGWTLVAAGTVVWGCSSSSSEGSGTTGKTITLRTAVAIQGSLSTPTTNALGWSVVVSKAYLSIGALYYFQGDPVISQRQRGHGDSPGSRWTWLGNLFERPAYAHPGHYIQGEAMGQMTTPTTIDLLGGSVELAAGTGVSGMTNSARFTFQSPPLGELAGQLAGHVVLTEGVATKGQDTVYFTATADQADVLDGNALPEVSGCAFGSTPGQVGADMQSDGVVTLTLVPTVWFEQVDFSYVLPARNTADAGTDAARNDEAGLQESDAAAITAGTGTAPSAVGSAASPFDIRGTIAWHGFVRGVEKGTAYLFSYSK